MNTLKRVATPEETKVLSRAQERGENAVKEIELHEVLTALHDKVLARFIRAYQQQGLKLPPMLQTWKNLKVPPYRVFFFEFFDVFYVAGE